MAITKKKKKAAKLKQKAKSKPSSRWELYFPTTSERADFGPYLSPGPYETRKAALAARDNFTHYFGADIDVRELRSN